MAYKIIFHPLADKEFSAAYKWYEERLAGLGNQFTEAVGKCVDQIAKTPLLFAKKKSGIESKSRFFSLFNYL